jgi:hypothetical protein
MSSSQMFFNFKTLSMDEVIIPKGTPWRMEQERILRNHNKLCRNFNQLLAHLMTMHSNHPSITYGLESEVKDHYLAADCKSLLRQLKYFCQCVCPIGEDDEYCKTCHRIIVEKD